MRGDRPRVIVEEFIDFDSEITLLTVATKDGILFCPPVGHRQELGDYRESWQPAALSEGALYSARNQARKVVTALGGHGIFGVEFFVRGDQAIFSELSPRPHDTGMVTLISQFPNEFELHLRAVLGLPIPSVELAGPSASAVILAARESDNFSFEGISDALALGAPDRPVDVRIFAKPKTLKNRRMGIALARGQTAEEAVERARFAASRVKIRYSD
jgi:phosphoribosylglycinamide formyltransferase 2